MSKIGKISISIPDKVKVALSENSVNVEGPFGKKVLSIDTANSSFTGDVDEIESGSSQAGTGYTTTSSY